jgi:Acyl-CoA dehydrogenase, N-terminal domain/Acyl-CoA dehydrogenase N terminal
MFAARGFARVLAQTAVRPSASIVRVPFTLAPPCCAALLPNAAASTRSTHYVAPLEEVDFVLNDLLNVQEHYKKVGAEEATPEMVTAVLEECSKFSEEKLAPLDDIGDKVGCKFSEGVVTTPPGFKEAYDEYSAGGWCGLSVPVEYGGQGLPLSLGVVRSEFTGCANWSWGMYPGLSMGAMNTLLLHGSTEQKETVGSSLALLLSLSLFSIFSSLLFSLLSSFFSAFSSLCFLYFLFF